MSLPSSINLSLVERFGAQPREVMLLSHGERTHAARCTMGGERVVVKWLAQPDTPPGWPDACAAEARGLAALEAAGALRVPRVHLQAEANAEHPAFIVLEWIETEADADRQAAGAALGEGLAALHRHSAPAYGLDHNNYCGATPQTNGWIDSWIEFYGQRRLGAQMELAQRQGLMPPARQARLERLIERLDRWLDAMPEPPSLMHGDLWGGNWLINPSGAPVLIDPAIYYGHREAELAMCHLFGGFPPAFFAAYDEAWPPAPNRDERMPLYQLYHLLNHLNLFGESYGARVDRVLRRYVG